MPRTVNVHQLPELSNKETPNEILLDTQLNTQLHIIQIGDKTIINFPFGNKFDIINNEIIIHAKN